MADVPAKRDEPKPPAEEGRTVTPRVEPWQIAPPGPPGAAIEPPPCSPSGVPFQVMTAPAAAPRFDMPPAPHEGPPPPTRPEWFVYGLNPPTQYNLGPLRAPLYRTDPNTFIGTPTPPDQLKRLEEASGYTSPEARGR